MKRRGQDFDTKFVFERVHSKEVGRRIFLRNWTNRGVNKLFKKLRDTGTVNRRPGMADRTVPALKKTLSFFRSSHSLPVAYCGNFWSRSLARFMRAAQFASVSSCARCLLKHFRRKSLQIIRDRDDRWTPVSRDIPPTVLWVCGLSCWLRTKPLTVSTFSPMRAQIDNKSKYKYKNSDTENFIYSQYGERLAILNSENIKNLWMNNNVRGD